MNKVILIGNLSRDFELRYLNTGVAVGNVSIATNRTYTREDGTKEQEVCFIDLSMYGRTAEVCNQYLKKGSKICVEGRLVYQQWNDTQGNKKSKHVIVVEKVEFLDPKNAIANDDNMQSINYANNQQLNNANQVIKPQVEASINLNDIESNLDSMLEKHFNIYPENEKTIIHFKGTKNEYENIKGNWDSLFDKIKKQTGIQEAGHFDFKREIIQDEGSDDEIPF